MTSPAEPPRFPAEAQQRISRARQRLWILAGLTAFGLVVGVPAGLVAVSAGAAGIVGLLLVSSWHGWLWSILLLALSSATLATIVGFLSRMETASRTERHHIEGARSFLRQVRLPSPGLGLQAIHGLSLCPTGGELSHSSVEEDAT